MWKFYGVDCYVMGVRDAMLSMHLRTSIHCAVKFVDRWHLDLMLLDPLKLWLCSGTLVLNDFCNESGTIAYGSCFLLCLMVGGVHCLNRMPISSLSKIFMA